VKPTVRTEEHVGEWKVTIRADTLEEIFAEAARMLAGTGGRPGGTPGPWEPICLRARDAATLLVDWLNELLGRSEVEQRAYAGVRGLSIVDGALDAEVQGAPVDVWRSPVKAATYHGLRLDRDGGRWRAVVLLDI